MAVRNASYTGKVPELYDQLYVPLVFERYAIDLAERVVRPAPTALLETAAGTGVLARALLPRLPLTTRYVCTDLSQPMLKLARSRQHEQERIEWRQADALDLPFGDHEFDVVVCQFGIMFFADRIAGLAEMVRVLKPGGTVIYSSLDRIAENAFAECVETAVASVFADDPPTYLSDIPYSYHDVVQLRADAAAAGLLDITVDTLALDAIGASAHEVASAFCSGTPLGREIERCNPARILPAFDAAERLLTSRFGTGTIQSGTRAHVVTARAPR